MQALTSLRLCDQCANCRISPGILYWLLKKGQMCLKCSEEMEEAEAKLGLFNFDRRMYVKPRELMWSRESLRSMIFDLSRACDHLDPLMIWLSQAPIFKMHSEAEGFSDPLGRSRRTVDPNSPAPPFCWEKKWIELEIVEKSWNRWTINTNI